jgi:hypothetical protein
MDERRHVSHLNHERGHSALAALRVHLSSTDERSLAFGERDRLVVCTGAPTAAVNSDKDLTEPRFVRADYAARFEVDDVCVCFTFALGELDRRGELYVVGPPADPFGKAR